MDPFDIDGLNVRLRDLQRQLQDDSKLLNTKNFEIQFPAINTCCATLLQHFSLKISVKIWKISQFI